MKKMLPQGGTIVVVSPHADDAALSCGATIQDAIAQGNMVVLVTCFSISAYTLDKPDGMDSVLVTRLRCAEDRAFTSFLGESASYVPLAFQDAPIRGEWLWSETCSGYPLTSLEVGLIRDITQALKALLYSSVCLLAPAAVGGHVDHRIVHEASTHLLCEGYNVWFYEDLPYSTVRGLNASAISPSLICNTIELPIGFSKQKEHLLSFYRSQVDADVISRVIEHGSMQSPDCFTEKYWCLR